jgi:hypothetical protein
MKIHQLPDGARFEYEGEEYVKTGPMFATTKGGQRRMIPKYAVLTPLGAIDDTSKRTKSATLPRAQVLAAFAAYHAGCRRLVPEERQPALDAARDQFLKALD